MIRYYALLILGSLVHCAFGNQDPLPKAQSFPNIDIKPVYERLPDTVYYALRGTDRGALRVRVVDKQRADRLLRDCRQQRHLWFLGTSQASEAFECRNPRLDPRDSSYVLLDTSAHSIPEDAFVSTQPFRNVS